MGESDIGVMVLRALGVVLLAFACTQSAVAKEGIVWATVPMTNTWTDNTKLCAKKGLDLCTKAQLCPGGKPAAKAKMVEWTAIKDANQWVKPKCEDHPGGRPGWGEKKGHVQWRNPKVACCTAATPTNAPTNAPHEVCPKGTGRQGQEKLKNEVSKMDESGCWPISFIEPSKNRRKFHSCHKASDCQTSKEKYTHPHSPVQVDTGCAYCPLGQHPHSHLLSGLAHHRFKENYVECGNRADSVSCSPGNLMGGMKKYTECEGTPKKHWAWDWHKRQMRGFNETSCITVISALHSPELVAGNYENSGPNQYRGQGVVVPEARGRGMYKVRCKMWKKTTCWRNHKGLQKCKVAKRYEFLGLLCMWSPCWANGFGSRAGQCGRIGSHLADPVSHGDAKCFLPADRYQLQKGVRVVSRKEEEGRMKEGYSELPAYFKQVDSEVGLCSLVSFVQ